MSRKGNCWDNVTVEELVQQLQERTFPRGKVYRSRGTQRCCLLMYRGVLQQKEKALHPRLPFTDSAPGAMDQDPAFRETGVVIPSL